MSKKKPKSPIARSEPEGAVPAEPSIPRAIFPTPHVDSMESLEEISEWLGTFRERLRVAREHERGHVAVVVQELEAHYRRRRAELA